MNLTIFYARLDDAAEIITAHARTCPPCSRGNLCARGAALNRIALAVAKDAERALAKKAAIESWRIRKCRR